MFCLPSCCCRNMASRAGWLAPAVFSLGLLLTSPFHWPVRADDDAKPKGQTWALLIGVEKYHRAPQLKYTTNDVRRIAGTLQTRAGLSDDNILEMTDQQSDQTPQPRFQPLRASLQAEVPKWLQKIEPDDTLLVYFSGHGFKDKEDKLYLAPLDCDPENLAGTAIPIEWLRGQIAGCKARFKLLVLDACHAGSEKGDAEKPGVAARDLGASFEDLAGVVTLASSTAKESSQIWDDKQQSLFSYWLNQGLRGNADADSNGEVDVDELYKYVFRRVTHTARVRFPLAQTPVRIVRPGTTDVPVVVRLCPQTLRQLLGEMAEQLSIDMELHGLQKVGVLEFTNDSPLGELLGANFGLLGRYCAEEFERRLMDAGAGKFSVVDRNQLQRALAQQGFGLADLGSSDSLRQLAARTDGMPVIAVGKLYNRMGRVVNLRVRLLQTQNDELAGSAGGMALLSPGEVGMTGPSVAVTPQDYSPPLAPPGQPGKSTDDQVVANMDKRAKGPHPLQDPNFPYRVEIKIDGKTREPVFKGNDCFVPVRKGEVYEIWVRTRTDKIVLMRLLVDGLNTLPEKETTKGVKVTVVGKRVNLDDAKHWELDPAACDPRLPNTWAVRGFVTEKGPQGKLREFVVVDAADSLAGRQKFTDQIGLITVAFHAPAGGARKVGTGLGKERDENIEKAHDLKPGNLLGVVHLRYVEADVLEKASK
jgi:hypothetical protein